MDVTNQFLTRDRYGYWKVQIRSDGREMMGTKYKVLILTLSTGGNGTQSHMLSQTVHGWHLGHLNRIVRHLAWCLRKVLTRLKLLPQSAQLWVILSCLALWCHLRSLAWLKLTLHSQHTWLGIIADVNWVKSYRWLRPKPGGKSIYRGVHVTYMDQSQWIWGHKVLNTFLTCHLSHETG